jgi:hypothetical protein
MMCFRGEEMISSQNALLYAYAFYLFGRVRLKAPEHKLQTAIGRWFFFSSLTGRYTNSPETVMDADLNRVKDLKAPEAFLSVLDSLIASEFTNDYWTITLPAQLATSSARNPQLFAYTASQNRVGAKVLFSHKKVSDLLDPALKTKKKPLERHHLLPRAYLEENVTTDQTEINQTANFALIEWPENIDIGKKVPAEYMAEIRLRFKGREGEIAQMMADHALPAGWELMTYSDFLEERRKLMAAIIRRGFATLVDQPSA